MYQLCINWEFYIGYCTYCKLSGRFIWVFADSTSSIHVDSPHRKGCGWSSNYRFANVLTIYHNINDLKLCRLKGFFPYFSKSKRRTFEMQTNTYIERWPSWRHVSKDITFWGFRSKCTKAHKKDVKGLKGDLLDGSWHDEELKRPLSHLTMPLLHLSRDSSSWLLFFIPLPNYQQERMKFKIILLHLSQDSSNWLLSLFSNYQQ